MGGVGVGTQWGQGWGSGKGKCRKRERLSSSHKPEISCEKHILIYLGFTGLFNS